MIIAVEVWDSRIRTYAWRYQKPLPYLLAIPQNEFMTKYSNFKDHNLRQKYKKKDKQVFLFKSLLLNERNSSKIRFKIMLKLDRIYRELSYNKIKGRCMFSTKVRSISRMTNLTKSSFRDNLRLTNISGFKKASW